MLNQVKEIIESVVSTRKGTNVTLCWKRNAKTRKTCTHTIEKEVCTSGRLGINYDNQQAVAVKRASGELPSENAGLPWGKWQMYPYLIEHKDNVYLRLYRNTSVAAVPAVYWYLDGQEVSFQTVEPFLLASEKQTKKSGDCFNVKIADMVSVGE